MAAFYLASPAQVQRDITEVKEPPLDTLFYEKGPNGNTVLSTWNVDVLGLIPLAKLVCGYCILEMSILEGMQTFL